MTAPCWQRIGVAGDRSCPELATHVHCRNCPVFVRGAGELFDRAVPPDYLEWLTTTIAAEPPDELQADRPLLVFRAAGEWFAIDATAVRTVAPRVPVRRLPHRRDPALAGIVAVRGELVPCITLGTLLGLPEPEVVPARPVLVVVEDRDGAFALAVDEALGVVAVSRAGLRPPPDTVRKVLVPITEGLQEIEGRDVTVIARDGLFERMMGTLL
ncbi:MAG: chemotaxis protein CheW [Chloroflexota bacterium]